MKKFLIGVFTGLILAGLTGVILVFSLARLGERRPEIADGSTLLYRLEGDIPEQNPTESPFPSLTGHTPATMLEHYQTLRRAASDSRIKAVVFMPHGVSAGWAKMQEVRDGLLAFKKSGKPLIAYLSRPTTREYYMATAADKIYMSHEDLLDLKGLRIEAMFFKNTLDKIGAQIDVEHAGKYKDAGDMFTRTSLSPESREVLNSVLDGIYGTLVQAIADGRHLNADDVRRTIDNGPFLAQQAVDDKFVDALYYEDEMYGEVRKQLKQGELKKALLKDYVKAAPATSGKKIAVITGDGSITRGSETESFQNESGITETAFTKLLRQVGSDSSINGVILRVDSPGGDAIASDDILREVKLLSQKKPLVVSMSDTAASGGYYISVTGDPILAYPNTLTGSIGVIFGKLNIHGLYDKLGIQKDILKRGEDADIDSDYAPLTPKGQAKLREGIDSVYQVFLQRVAAGRKRSVGQIEPLAQGRVWLGSQAKQNGLVDELGGIDKAVEMIKSRAKIGAGETVRLVAYPPKRSIFDQLFKRQDDAALAEAEIRKLVKLRGIDLRLWSEPGIKTVLPIQLDVR